MSQSLPSNSPREPAKDSDFMFKKDLSKIFFFEDIAKNELAILDSRFKPNFDAGHLPGSTSLPFTIVFNADKSFK